MNIEAILFVFIIAIALVGIAFNFYMKYKMLFEWKKHCEKTGKKFNKFDVF